MPREEPRPRQESFTSDHESSGITELGDAGPSRGDLPRTVVRVLPVGENNRLLRGNLSQYRATN